MQMAPGDINGTLTWLSYGIGDGDLGEAQVATLQDTAQGVPTGGFRNVRIMYECTRDGSVLRE